jgi:large subunit ribosomal protein L6
MSRIGKRPIPVPAKVTVDIQGLYLTVKGPKGTLERQLPDKVIIAQEGETLTVVRQDESRTARERHGLVRTLVAMALNVV